jgi:hypothetical protein
MMGLSVRRPKSLTRVLGIVLWSIQLCFIATAAWAQAPDAGAQADGPLLEFGIAGRANLIRMVNVGGPYYDRHVPSRSLRPHVLNVNVTPGPNTLVADFNTLDLAKVVGKNVETLRATNVPFCEGVPGSPFVDPQVFVQQAEAIGAKRIVLTTGKRGEPHILGALERAGWLIRIRDHPTRGRFIAAMRPRR